MPLARTRPTADARWLCRQPRRRELLRSVLGDIEAGAQPESIIERLRQAFRVFETTPRR
jgi:hypothetical protein